MQLIHNLFDLLIHLDKHLLELIQQMGFGIYFLLFAIIFMECGVIFTPFLPGESLLFATGTIAAQGVLDIHLIFISLSIAAICGGFLNYYIGKKTGNYILQKPSLIRLQPHIQRTNEFYAKHGGKTILLARLIPIIRTYAPFVAGIAKMRFNKFFWYNTLGGILWVGVFTYISFHFGNITIVKQNFSLIILGIIIVSIIPITAELYKQYRSK